MGKLPSAQTREREGSGGVEDPQAKGLSFL